MRKLLSLATAATAILLTTGAMAQTGTLFSTQTLNYGSQGTPLTVAVSDALNFTKYSHAGHHLTDVWIAITANSYSSTYISNSSGAAHNWTSASGSIDDIFATVAGTSQADLQGTSLSSVSSNNSNKTIANGGHYTAVGNTVADSYALAQITDTAKFSDFIGVGSGTLTVSAPTDTQGFLGNTLLNDVLTMNVYGSVTLNYYEAPNPVSGTPEPGTWALLGAGACTSVAAIRRRRRSK